jgi:hypothetical protein
MNKRTSRPLEVTFKCSRILEMFKVQQQSPTKAAKVATRHTESARFELRAGHVVLRRLDLFSGSLKSTYGHNVEREAGHIHI